MSAPEAVEAANSSRPVGWLVEIGVGLPTPEMEISQGIQNRVLEELSKLPIHFVSTEEIKQKLRHADKKQHIDIHAGQTLSKARELHLGLKLEDAIAAYQKTLEIFDQGFVRYYDVGLYAEPLLQLGVVLFEAGRIQQAQRTFEEVLRLVPSLQLSEGYFSPRIRAFVSNLRPKAEIGQRPMPDSTEMTSICQALGLDGLIYVSWERIGEKNLLRLVVFDALEQRLQAVETAMVGEDSPNSVGAELGQRLVSKLSQWQGISALLVDLPEEPDESHLEEEQWNEQAGKVDGGVLEENSEGMDGAVHPAFVDFVRRSNEDDSPSWAVRHWWVWPIAAAIVGTAVVLPLTVFRRDVVDVRITY